MRERKTVRKLRKYTQRTTPIDVNLIIKYLRVFINNLKEIQAFLVQYSPHYWERRYLEQSYMSIGCLLYPDRNWYQIKFPAIFYEHLKYFMMVLATWCSLLHASKKFFNWFPLLHRKLDAYMRIHLMYNAFYFCEAILSNDDQLAMSKSYVLRICG